MSFKDLYDEVQACQGRVSTKQLVQWAIHYSEITAIQEIWSERVDSSKLRGFYIEGPLGPPVPVAENAALIVLSRPMCKGTEGKYWRRLVKTKELMHVFDTPEEKAFDGHTLDVQLEGFKKPSSASSPQYKAEDKAYWRALAALCPEAKRLEYKDMVANNGMGLEVLSATLHIPKAHVWRLLVDDFDEIIKEVLN